MEQILNPLNFVNKSGGATLAVARTGHTRSAWQRDGTSPSLRSVVP